MKHVLLIKNAAYYTLTSYLVMPVSIVSTILIRQWMDPYIFGVIATLNLFVLYSVFSNLGTLGAAEVKLPYYRGKGDMLEFEKIRSTTFAFTLLSGCMFSIGVAAWVILERTRIDEYLFMGMLVYCVYFVVNQVVCYYITLLRADSEFIFLSKLQLYSGLLTSGGNIFAVWTWGFKGFLAVAIINIFFQGGLLIRHVKYRPLFSLNLEEAKILLIGGLPMLILGLSAQGMKTIDNFLVLEFLGTEQLGFYTIALVANMIIFSVTNSIGNVLYPSMQAAYGRSGSSDSLRLYVIRPTLIVGLFLPIMISSLYFFVPMVVHWIIPKFDPGMFAFKIIVLSTYFFSIVNMSTGYLISINKQKILVIFSVFTLVLIAALAKMSVTFGWGLEGIALATGIGYFVYFSAISIFVLRHWATWKQTMVFLFDTSFPFFYGLGLILVIERFLSALAIANQSNFPLATFQLMLFLICYSPCFLILERKTRLICDFVSPLYQNYRWRK